MTDTITAESGGEPTRITLKDGEIEGLEPVAAPVAEPEKEDVLELGSEEAPELTDEQKAAAEEDKQRKSRSQRWEKRVDNLTARLREAERRATEAEARVSGQPVKAPSIEEVTAKKPDPAQFEYGAADPEYLEAITDWKLELRDAKTNADREKQGEEGKKVAAQQEVVAKLHEGMAAIEKTGAEKYDDFEEKLGAAVEARGGEPLHPMVSVGIAVSPAGADVAYKLATDEAAADKIESLAKTNPQAAAVAFGELEGEFVDDDDDLNLGDPLDMARMIGRMKTRLAGKGPEVERKVSKAPAPPEQRARGAGGKFEGGERGLYKKMLQEFR
jgi:hypothetical protein